MYSLPLTWVAAVILGALLTWLARRAAVRIGLLDFPDQERKNHRAPVPLLGGVAVLASLLAAVGGMHAAAAAGWIALDFGPQHRGMFLSAIAFCAVGLADDRYTMRARTKLLLQIAAAMPFMIGGRVISECGMLGLDVDLGWWGPAVTLFWIILCVNSVNLLDGLDGVAGTVGVVVSSTVCLLALNAGQWETALIALALCGSLIGFLVFNWPPAKIFLGDSGSLTIGFLLGALAIEGSLKTAAGLTLAAPLVLMSIPGFDTTMAVLRRVLNGRGVGHGDRSHLHHCLKDRGLSAAQTVLAIGSMCLAMGSAVVASTHFRNDWIAVGGCAALLLVLIAGRVFGFEETRLLWQVLRRVKGGWVRSAAKPSASKPGGWGRSAAKLPASQGATAGRPLPPVREREAA